MPQITLADPSWNWSRESEPEVDPDAGRASWSCQGSTDYWRLTHSGHVSHNGHACLTEARGDFEISGQFQAKLLVQFDQTGFLVEAGPELWFKGGFEREGPIHAGGVLTRGTSDWSLAPAALPASLRLRRRDTTLELFWRRPEASPWTRLRQLTLPGPVRVGFFSASPLGRGFRVSLTGFELSLQS